MKCPYRKIIIRNPVYKPGEELIHITITEEFADCYEDDCPYYYEKIIDVGLCAKVAEECEE